MKIIVIIFLSISIFGYSQEKASVSKSINSIQIGFLGAWMNNEIKINNSITIKSEIGLDTGLFGGIINNGNKFIITPVITLEPRMYYNLQKRSINSKNITFNSGNFITLKTSFKPNWFTISNYPNIKVNKEFTIIPTWGIRRALNNNFAMETGIGIGYKHIFNYSSKNNRAVINLHLRIGYNL